MARDRVEVLLELGHLRRARRAIAEELAEEPESHWLWSQLSAVEYEERNYRAALKAAQKARRIVPDCPLTLWYWALAQEALGRVKAAERAYVYLFRRGLQQLREPDEDAEQCWEGRQWTYGLVADCAYSIAECLAKTRHTEQGIDWYLNFLSLLDSGACSIYTRADALRKLKQLTPRKRAISAAAMARMERAGRELEQVIGRATRGAS